MTMHRRLHRLATTLVVVLSLLFSQLALARYVCPQQADIEAMAAMMEAGQPCAGADPVQPALCHQHAADPASTFEAVKLPVAGLPAIVQVIERPPLTGAPAGCIVPATARCEAQPAPDPLFLSTLRLRV